MRALYVLVPATFLVTAVLAQNPVVWTTYLGGRFNEAPNAVAVGSDGSVYVAGATQSPDFPTTAGALRKIPPKTAEQGEGRLKRILPGQFVGFLARLDTSGRRLLYGTYVGGSVSDSVNALAVDSTGGVYLAGGTQSPDLPVTSNAPQKKYRGSGDSAGSNPGDGFVMRLDREGKLEFATFLGGNGPDLVSAIADGSGGVVYAVGSTDSTDFANQQASSGAVDGFVAKIDTRSGNILWTLRLTQPGATTPVGVAVAQGGTVFVAGIIETPDSLLAAGSRDVFLAKIGQQGNLADFASLGGSDAETVVGPVIGQDGSVYLAGETKSVDLGATPGTYQAGYQGGSSDAFAVKITPDGRRSYLTYIGSKLYEGVGGLAVDPQGRAHLIGKVAGGSDLRNTSGAPEPPHNTGQHLFYAVVSPSGKRLEFLSQYGGRSAERGPFRITRDAKIALGPDGNAYVVAMTTDDIAASPGAFQGKTAGGHALVVVRFSTHWPPPCRGVRWDATAQQAESHNLTIATSETITFRRMTEADLDYVMAIERAAAQERFVWEWSREQHEDGLKAPGRLHLIIESVSAGRPVGFILMNDIHSASKCIEFQRIVVEPRDQGYGRQAIRLLKRYAFEELKAHRLWLSVKDFNSRGRALYRSEGFVEEGTLRECVKGADSYESVLIMAILDREYESA